MISSAVSHTAETAADEGAVSPSLQTVQIAAEQTKLLYTQAPIGFGVNLLNTAILTAVFRDIQDSLQVYTWAACMVVITLARMVLVHYYHRAKPDAEQNCFWRRAFTIGAACSGCGWGLGSIVLFPPSLVMYQLFLAIVLAGMVVGAVIALSAVRAAYLSFYIPATIPIIIELLLSAETIPFALGLIAVVFISSVLVMALQYHTTISESLGLRFERQNLLESQEILQQAHGELEVRVRERTAALQAEVNERMRSEARARAMLQAVPDLVCRLNRDGVYLDYEADKAVEGDVTPEKLVGKRLTDTLPATVVQQALEAIGKVLRTGEVQVFEYTLTLRGQNQEFEARIAQCGIDEVVAIIRNITQRKEVERLKDELVSVVSHELRTPLTSLRGYIELLSTRSFPEEQQQEILTILQREAVRLTNLINDFLSLRRMEAGRETYKFKPVALSPLLHEILSLFHASSERHIFELDVLGELPAVEADAARLQQVVANLLSNAVKFSPAGGNITLGAQVQDNAVCIWVADQGVGIAPDALPKVFDRFYRVDNQATRDIGGTGLGLTLVKEIITAHKGHIWVESESGRGSTFYFTLPIAEPITNVDPWPLPKAVAEG